MKYIPCLLPLSLKSNSLFFSHKNYPYYCIISLYCVKCKNQNPNCFCPPFFLQRCLPPAPPCIGKDFFPFALPALLRELNNPSPTAAPYLWGANSCMGFALPQPTSQLPPNTTLGGGVSAEGRRRTLTKVTSELWTNFYLKLWCLFRQLIATRSGCFTVRILQEQSKRCSVAYLVLSSSSFSYGDAKIFLFVSLVFTKQFRQMQK